MVAKGASFAYGDAFGDEDDIVDLLEFCDRTVTRRNSVGVEGAEGDEEGGEDEGEDYSVSEAEQSEDDADLLQPNISVPSDNDANDGSPEESDNESEPEPGMDIPIPQRLVHPKDKRESKPAPKKYVPPSARGRGDSATVVKRRMRGLLNRVAEANASSIAAAIIRIFEDRQPASTTQSVAETYAQCTLDAVRDGSGVGYINPYLQSHASIATHVSSRVSRVVLASLLVSAVRRFHSELPMLEAESGLLNDGPNRSDVYGYTALLVSLYERRAVSCTIVYDLVRTVGESLSSERLGLLLALLRQVGPMLRQDDPKSLKDMIEFIHDQADKVTNCLDTTAEESVKLKLQIMLELIDDIKNNKMKRSALQAANAKHAWVEAPDPPLSASLSDLLNDSFTSTRWWDADGVKSVQASDEGEESVPGTEMKNSRGNEPNINRLASSLRLTTGRRKDLFKAIMASPSVSEAYERLQDMSAFDSKKHHDRDTAIVILHCCGSEKIFNPFYAYLAERMCKRARRSRFTFEFACWDIFKSIPGSEKAKPMSQRRARNFEHLLAHLWYSQALSLSVLRYAQDFEECGEDEVAFYVEAMDILFSKLVSDGEDSAGAPFEKLISETWNGADAFRVSLGLFLRSKMRPRLKGQQKQLLKRAIRILEDRK
ncbi:unnamed protein product [Chondrus crispus]|uniref:MI domain-containing protein n=1 Tax=Chondrus crispus TaxID=2769 RepID=R7QF14_CHOCR|nr:unnamed protein product [Chondrus crispus]CDF35985.1 unnamed protein product [Chondrus crispus]|eukprot:XP_005715804.1 unnamed protein product [Chondrus crispus]